jgi:hypothetical protein
MGVERRFPKAWPRSTGGPIDLNESRTTPCVRSAVSSPDPEPADLGDLMRPTQQRGSRSQDRRLHTCGLVVEGGVG